MKKVDVVDLKFWWMRVITGLPPDELKNFDAYIASSDDSGNFMVG